MPIELTEQQLDAMRASPKGPIRMRDPRTNADYLLLRAAEVGELKARAERLDDAEDDAVQVAWRRLNLQGLALRLRDDVP